MDQNEKRKPPEKFSDLFKSSWVKSAIKIGIILTIAGLIILPIFKFFNLGSDQLFLNTARFIVEYGLVGILFATILAGTLVPLGSPALVTVAALFGIPKIPLILVATIGFTVGVMINYGLAYHLGRPYVMKKVTAERLEEITLLWGRWGWVLYTIFGLIPVLPVELLSLFCGLLKTRLDIFLILSFTPRLVVFTILAYFGEIAGSWIGLI
jgi:membrane protein YqaA with SNARE-associated domain